MHFGILFKTHNLSKYLLYYITHLSSRFGSAVHHRRLHVLRGFLRSSFAWFRSFCVKNDPDTKRGFSCFWKRRSLRALRFTEENASRNEDGFFQHGILKPTDEFGTDWILHSNREHDSCGAETQLPVCDPPRA